MWPPSLVRLQLHHHRIGVGIKAQKVDAARTVLPVAELLGEHHQPLFKAGDILP
jgi:hypothetical protein